jgi:hypothetical protein
MGCYVNPPDVSKEVWLLEHGCECGRIGRGTVKIPAYNSFEQGRLPVVLVQNGPFRAAAVAYCEDKYKEFTRMDDDRYREVYSVATSDLRGVSDIDRYLKRMAGGR